MWIVADIPSAKQIHNLTMILAACEQSRAWDRGEYTDGGAWPDAPSRVLAAKFRKLSRRGIMDERGVLDPVDGWNLPAAEKAEVLAALDAAGHRFGKDGRLLVRQEDARANNARRKAANEQDKCIRESTPTTVLEFIQKMTLVVADGVNAEWERRLLEGT